MSLSLAGYNFESISLHDSPVWEDEAVQSSAVTTFAVAGESLLIGKPTGRDCVIGARMYNYSTEAALQTALATLFKKKGLTGTLTYVNHRSETITFANVTFLQASAVSKPIREASQAKWMVDVVLTFRQSKVP